MTEARTEAQTCANPHFPLLFSPLQVGPMRVANRICETTNSIGAGRADGMPDDPFIAHHLAKARGGTAWIGNETWVLPSPLPAQAPDEMFEGGGATRFGLYNLPNFAERMAHFCDALHDAGAVAVMQLTHLNSTMAPSSIVTAEAYDYIPHELTEDEIESILQTYGDAAARMKEGHVDGVEIHAAHDTLPQMFLSPGTNKRKDKWGGDAYGRTRFIVEALERIRKRVGDSMAVGIRIDAFETRQGGYDLLQMREMMVHIADSGLLDFVDLDVGHSWGVPSYVMPSYYDPAQYREVGKAVKVDIAPIPVLFSGRVNEPTVAEQLLAGGYADLVGMTRAGIADPEFANKAREGRMFEMRRCIACNRCIGDVVHGRGLRQPHCSVNPVVGNELFWEQNYRPAEQRKRVVVVGGGAAGLETARIAAMRGHDVVVLEREKNVGGQVRIASKAPGRGSFEDFVYFQENQLQHLGVEVRTGVTVGVEEVLALKPDAVVCATGSEPLTPDVPGVDSPMVVQGWDVLQGRAKVGQRVAVISAEDHYESVNVADFLAEQGKQVEVFQKWTTLGKEIDRYSIGIVMKRLEQGGVKLSYGQRLAGVHGSCVDLVSAYTGQITHREDFDTVVLVYGSQPDARLYKALDGKVTERFLIGSAWVPRGIYEATQHGMKVALAL
ncbi:MAG: FAD-dependent oxidoreductase [Dehalococcoidia bacterium]|nr:FAD-dependent oxidoreductase [Dehalococcoidia bacterium]